MRSAHTGFPRFSRLLCTSLLLVGLCAFAARGADAPATDPALLRKQNALRLIWKEGEEAAADSPARAKLREEFLTESAAFVKTYPSSAPIWTLRAAAALELKRPREAWEAGRKMIELGLDKSENALIQDTLTRLERLKWLGEQPPAGTPTSTPTAPTAKGAPAPAPKPDSATEAENRLALAELQQIVKELAAPANALRLDEIRRQFLDKSAAYLKRDTENIRVWTLRGLVHLDVFEDRKSKSKKMLNAVNESMDDVVRQLTEADEAEIRLRGVGTKLLSLIKSGQQDAKAEEFLALLRRKELQTEPDDVSSSKSPAFPDYEYPGKQSVFPPVPIVLKLAESGDANAMLQVGYAYYSEVGIPQDYKEAKKWFQSAANLGNKEAMLYLAHLLQWKEKNREQAESWLRKAAEDGNLKAVYWLSELLRRQEKEAKDLTAIERRKHEEGFQLLKRVADETGYWMAMAALSTAYRHGRDYGYGVDQNESEALRYNLKAMANGCDWDSVASEIGDAYYNGNGTTKNGAEAVKWWRKAIDLDKEGENDSAMKGLARAYFEGRGVNQNIDSGLQWLLKACKNDRAEAVEWLKTVINDSANNTSEALMKEALKRLKEQ